MTVERPLSGAEGKRPGHCPVFSPGSTVDVRQVDDQHWTTLRVLIYAR